MAVKAINDTAGPDGLVPTLLVFGTYPRISYSSPPTPSSVQRAKAIQKAMHEISQIYAKRQVNDALSQRNGPQNHMLIDVAIGSEVLVWRTHLKKWTGPFKLLSIENQTCTVDLPYGPTKFRSTIVKPYRTLDTANENNDQKTIGAIDESELPETPTADASDSVPRRNPVRQRQIPSRYQN
ncbi:hypothetical protein K3495_g17245, partial [Podosphaera aphanis]